MYLIYYGEQSGELKLEFGYKIDWLFGHEVKSSQVNHRKMHHSLQTIQMFISSHLDTIPNDNALCSTCVQSSLKTTPLVTKHT